MSDLYLLFMTIGANIARIRKAQGMSQLDLASRLELPQPTLACYETGRRKPDPELLPVIAKSLGVPVQDLFSGVASAPEPTHENVAEKRIRPGTRLAKLCSMFEMLNITEQRLILRQIESLANSPQQAQHS